MSPAAATTGSVAAAALGTDATSPTVDAAAQTTRAESTIMILRMPPPVQRTGSGPRKCRRAPPRLTVTRIDEPAPGRLAQSAYWRLSIGRRPPWRMRASDHHEYRVCGMAPARHGGRLRPGHDAVSGVC